MQTVKALALRLRFHWECHCLSFNVHSSERALTLHIVLMVVVNYSY